MQSAYCTACSKVSALAYSEGLRVKAGAHIIKIQPYSSSDKSSHFNELFVVSGTCSAHERISLKLIEIKGHGFSHAK